jgi:hypothetical protein
LDIDFDENSEIKHKREESKREGRERKKNPRMCFGDATHLPSIKFQTHKEPSKETAKSRRNNNNSSKKKSVGQKFKKMDKNSK